MPSRNQYPLQKPFGFQEEHATKLIKLMIVLKITTSHGWKVT